MISGFDVDALNTPGRLIGQFERFHFSSENLLSS
jgi:hypothetical protein